MSSLDRLRAELAVRKLPALIVSDPGNVGWLTGFSGSFGFVLVTADQARFISDSRYTVQAAEEVTNCSVHTFASPKEAPDFLAEQLAEMGVTEAGFESASVVVATYERWRERLAGVRLISAGDVIGALRMVKDEVELAKIRRACGIADAAFAHIQRLIQPGVTELDVCLDLEFYMRRQGAEVAFPSIVVSGPRSARPHGKPSDRRLEVGDFVTLDFGARVEGYNSDITRTVVVGEASPRHAEVYNQVLKAQLAALADIKPGGSAQQTDALVRMILDEIGLAPFFGHGLGHGLGRLVHDTGRMNATSKDIFAPGQVWTVEPGVYLEGFGGVRIEDDVVVTEDGIEILTKSPKELLVLPA